MTAETSNAQGVVDEEMVERACRHWYAQWDKADQATKRVWAKTMYDLLTAALAAQQPAAVDEAMVERALIADAREYGASIPESRARRLLAAALSPSPADPRAAAEQAIAEALRRERMAPDDYAPMPDAPVPVENDE